MNGPREIRNPAGGRGFERWQTLAWAAWRLYITAAQIVAAAAIGLLIVDVIAAAAGRAP